LNDKSADSSSDSPPLRPGPPPLRIYHLLAATAVTSILLAVTKLPVGVSNQGATRMMQSGTSILSIVAAGMALTCVGFGFVWRRSGRRFFDQPGHWVLLLEAAPMLVFDVMVAVSAFIHRLGFSQYEHWPLLLYAISFFFGWPVLGVLAAWKGADTLWWRSYFILQILLIPAIPTSQLLGLSAMSLFSIISCGLLVLLTVAVIADHRAHRARDWSHWLGVVLWTSAIGVSLIAGIL
jgi:hypothetical protein